MADTDRDEKNETNGTGTGLDDGAGPTYEDGSPMDPVPEPNPTKPDGQSK